MALFLLVVNLASGWFFQPQNQLGGGGLATPGRTEKTEELTARDSNTCLPNGYKFAELNPNVFQLYVSTHKRILGEKLADG